MKFVYPTDGDMLTDAAGRIAEDGALMIEVCVQAEECVEVDGISAQRQADGTWRAEIALRGAHHTIRAKGKKEEICATVYRLPNAAGKYALSVDDNIWWLAELTTHPRKSLFDHPYLAVYRRMHEKYGAKVRMNLFYRVNECDEARYGAFDLSQMTDRYREEFIENSDWLHLAFHSFKESPAYPYREASAEQVLEDWKRVEQEIIRFAGEEALERATTLHFGACTHAGIRALGENGIRMLMGFMELDRRGNPSVSYNLSVDEIYRTQRYGFRYDQENGMIYGKIDVVLNSHSPEKIVQILDKQKAEHPLRGFVEIMIHEQYFYKDYFNYEPDYEARIEAGCRWCHERGYVGAFAQDVL